MRSTKKLTFCGILAGFALLLLCMTGLFPFAEYSLPALAGLLLVSVVIECGAASAWVCFLATALLGLILCPSKEAAWLFVLFFGYYPILKSPLERCRSRIAEWVLKFLCFNLAFGGCYALLIAVFRMEALLEDFSMLTGGWLYLFPLLCNLMFLLYDIALTRMIGLYLARIHGKFRVGQ